MARGGSPDECVGVQCCRRQVSGRAALDARGSAPDGCWLAERANCIAAVSRALLRLRQGGLAHSLRSGAPRWLGILNCYL
jgi:hypothetical protein